VSECLGPELSAAMLSTDGNGTEPQPASPSRPPKLTVEDLEPFHIPASLACYSVDVEGDNGLENLINNAGGLQADPSILLLSPSFRKKRIESMRFPSPKEDDRGARTGGSPLKAANGMKKPTTARPTRGVLVARIPCHSNSITGISENIGRQSTLFVTSSKDATCKLWDSRKLERDITFRARAVFNCASGVECCGVAPGPCTDSVFFAGRSDGVLDAWNVDRTALPLTSWTLSDGGHIADVQSCGGVCIASTASHAILGVDPRLKMPAWSVRTEPPLGVPMRLGIDTQSSSYFVVGTSRSYLTVWDARFMIPVSTWRNPAASPVEALRIAHGPGLGVASTGPIALAACGDNEISAWDIATSQCVLAMGCSERLGALKESVMDTSKPAEDPVGLARQMGALDLRSLIIKRTTIRALSLFQHGASTLIVSGGADRSMRVWNPTAGKGTADYMSVISSANHRDTITALRLVRGVTAATTTLLASASADGVLNVWK
jgi:WD40 repeat protein